MTKITDTREFGKIFGNALVKQSQLAQKYVINTKALYGGNMEDSSLSTIVSSFKPSETFITFMVYHSQSSDTMTEDIETGITMYDSFQTMISVYGKDTDVVTDKIYSRFLTQEVISYFEECGVHIQSIDNQGDVTDFLNNRLILRRDLIVHFSCEMSVNKVDEYSDISSAKLEPITVL